MPSFDKSAAWILVVVGALLVAGFVTLDALGRDTSAYVLFLSGPAVTAVVGAVLGERVKHVKTTVDATREQTKALVTEQVSGLDDHLAAQDETLTTLAGAVVQPVAATPTPRQAVPTARPGPVSPFGPVAAGLVKQGGTADDIPR